MSGGSDTSPLRGRHGQRDGEVRRRLDDLHAADRGRVDLGVVQLEAAAALQHGQQHRHPRVVQTAHRAARARDVRARDERLHLGQQRPPPVHHDGHGRAGHARVAGGPEPREEQPGRVGQPDDALRRAARSSPPRRPGRSGSSRRAPCAASTACRPRTTARRRRGAPAPAVPAMPPSFVTWPTSSTGSPRSLASAVSATVTARVWVTPPGEPSTVAVDMVWMESTTSRPGCSSSMCPSDRLEVGLGGEEQLVVHGAGALGAQPDLPGRLLAGDVEHTGAGSGLGGHLQQQRRLPDARLAGQQHDRAGDESAAEYPVELVDTGRPGARGVQLDVGDPPGRRARGARDDLSSGPALRLDLLERAPGLACRAAADPLRRTVSALGAEVAPAARGARARAQLPPSGAAGAAGAGGTRLRGLGARRALPARRRPRPCCPCAPARPRRHPRAGSRPASAR